jgi:hypothetical protein
MKHIYNFFLLNCNRTDGMCLFVSKNGRDHESSSFRLGFRMRVCKSAFSSSVGGFTFHSQTPCPIFRAGYAQGEDAGEFAWHSLSAEAPQPSVGFFPVMDAEAGADVEEDDRLSSAFSFFFPGNDFDVCFPCLSSIFGKFLMHDVHPKWIAYLHRTGEMWAVMWR